MLHVTAKGLADLGKLMGDHRGELTIILPDGSARFPDTSAGRGMTENVYS